MVGGTLALGGAFGSCAPRQVMKLDAAPAARGPEIDLRIADSWLSIGGRTAKATTINGGIPGPELRLREGENAVIRVQNDLEVTSSIHWHGLLVPPEMDGVPGVSFDGIPPGETFEYRFPIRQSGTYWYHSHSGFQEQTGVYGAIVIDPAEPLVRTYDREHTVVLSDWTFEDPNRILANLKRYGGYYNYQRRTAGNFGAEVRQMGFSGALGDRLRWSRMRMDATDISDITGSTYTYLFGGVPAENNWRGLFQPGERVLLRFINAGAGTYFDVRIPGLSMTVVATDGMPIEPVEVDEFRIAIAETYDVIVKPTASAYTIFAEAMDRSGFARGTLAVDADATAPIPQRRQRPMLTMQDMGMDHAAMGAGDMPDAAMDHSQHDAPSATIKDVHAGHGAMPEAEAARECAAAAAVMSRHGEGKHGAGNSMVAEMAASRLSDPGVGLRDATWRVLTYSQLRRGTAASDWREPTREIELHLTGNMERYMWSFDGVAYKPDMPPILLQYGERVRFVLINDTMMAHPIHLHGMFVELEVGACERNPLKHTVNVQPGERVSWTLTANEVGRWAFHCHILYHMAAGMFRVVEVRR